VRVVYKCGYVVCMSIQWEGGYIHKPICIQSSSVSGSSATAFSSANLKGKIFLKTHSPHPYGINFELRCCSSSNDAVAVRAAILPLLVYRDGGSNRDVLMRGKRHVIGLDGDGGGSGEDEGDEGIHRIWVGN